MGGPDRARCVPDGPRGLWGVAFDDGGAAEVGQVIAERRGGTELMEGATSHLPEQ